MRKSKNGEYIVRNFKRFFFVMSSDVLAFEVRVFVSDLEFWI